MEKKYELTEETRWFECRTLRRIRALKDFGNVCKGDLGGWIEKEENLSPLGNCWVYDNAMVCHDAEVYGNAIIREEACVFGSATIGDFAEIFGTAWVYGNVNIFGHARIYGDSEVLDKSSVYENAEVYGKTRIFETVKVYGRAKIYGEADLHGAIEVSGHAKIFGSSKIYGPGRSGIGGYSKVSSTDDVLIIGPIGSRKSYTTFAKSKFGIAVTCGCFSGTIIDFEKRVKKQHQGNVYEKQYLIAIRAAKELFSLKNWEER